MSEVDDWRAKCPPESLATVDALRAVIREAGPDLAESLKWNAPNFARGGEDRINLGLEKNGGVRAVLHRGAAPRTDGFAFADTAKLARWPSPDRGVVKFRDAEEVDARRAPLVDLFTRWLEAAR